MNYIHKNLAAGKWFELTFAEQLANIGAEVGRATNWQKKDTKISQLAFERALELLDLTLQDKKNHTPGRLKELGVLRGVMIDYFMENNECGSTPENWNSYFYFFNAAAMAKYVT